MTFKIIFIAQAPDQNKFISSARNNAFLSTSNINVKFFL